MAVKFDQLRIDIRNAFPSIPEDRSFNDFIRNLVIDEKSGKRTGGAFGDAFRKYLGRTANVELDFNVDTLKSVGWSALEANIINKAFKDIATTLTTGPGTETLKIRGNKIDITGRYKFKGKKVSPFAAHGLIFKEVIDKAFELITQQYQGFTTNELTIADINRIHNQLKEVGRESLPFDLVYNELDTGTKVAPSGKIQAGTIEKLAHSRLGRLAGKLKGPKLDVHAGHLEGRENLRLAAAGRIAIGAYAEGFLDSDGQVELDENLVAQVAYTLDMEKDIVHSLFQATYGKINVKGGYEKTKVVQHTTMELSFLNVDKDDERDLPEEIGKLLLELFNKWSQAKHTAADLAEQGNSPSIIQIVEDFIIRSMSGNKGRSLKHPVKPKYKKRYKPIKSKFTADTKALRKLLKAKKRVDFSVQFAAAAKRAKGGGLNLLRLHAVINEVLAINVEKQMGPSDGTDGRLRYQTGRFADSAKLLTLTRGQAGVLVGTYSYQENPYDVFLPGHKLATPKRDPRIYVEGAIREAAITILQKKFPGIVLGKQ